VGRNDKAIELRELIDGLSFFVQNEGWSVRTIEHYSDNAFNALSYNCKACY
jgi:hypothetical protein